MKVFIFNDTRYEYHHGCTMVMSAIFNVLRLRKVSIIGTSPAGHNWREDESLLFNLTQADLIIVNGEGTMHHSNHGAHLLAEVAEHCSTIHKPCHLINAVFDSNNIEIANMVRKFDSVYVRENYSKRELKKIDIKSEVIPDLSFYWIGKTTKSRSNKIGITDSVANMGLNKLLFSKARMMDAKYLPILTHPFPVSKRSLKGWLIFLRYLLGYLTYWSIRLFNDITIERKQKYYFTSSSLRYMSKVASCAGLLTGRYHGLCFAIITNTPFLVMSSNSHKIEGLLADIGIGLDRLISKSDLELENKIKIPEFSKKELDQILDYSSHAKTRIERMFDDILR